jgi:hypothetical protein
LVDFDASKEELYGNVKLIVIDYPDVGINLTGGMKHSDTSSKIIQRTSCHHDM